MKKLLNFEKLINKRIEGDKKEVNDKYFDEQFKSLIIQLDNIDVYINNKFKDKFKKYKSLKITIYFIIALLILLTLYLVLKFTRDIENKMKVIKNQSKEINNLNTNLEKK